MGLNLFSTIKQFSFGCSLQKQFVGLNSFDLMNCCTDVNCIDSLVDGHENISDMMCCDHFICSQMSHSSCIHF